MTNAEPPLTLPVASIEAILAAAGRSPPYNPSLIDALAEWLAKAMERATGRAQQRPLTRADVDKLERAYLHFLGTVQGLQDRVHPPPSIPVRDGETDWGHWVATQRAFGLKPGRHEGADWLLIGELIALYEATGRRASAAQGRGPTMRFLGAAMRELQLHAPAEVRSKFQSPDVAALRPQLAALRRGYFRFLAQDLVTLLTETGGLNAPE